MTSNAQSRCMALLKMARFDSCRGRHGMRRPEFGPGEAGVMVSRAACPRLPAAASDTNPRWWKCSWTKATDASFLLVRRYYEGREDTQSYSGACPKFCTAAHCSTSGTRNLGMRGKPSSDNTRGNGSLRNCCSVLNCCETGCSSLMHPIVNGDNLCARLPFACRIALYAH